MKNTYWCNNGKYQKVADEIGKYVPRQNNSDIPIIEIFRVVANAYYDLYNNGGGNACRWEFVPIVKEQLKIIDGYIEEKKQVLINCTKLRTSVTLVGCFPKKLSNGATQDECFEKVAELAEEAINSIIELYIAIDQGEG